MMNLFPLQILQYQIHYQTHPCNWNTIQHNYGKITSQQMELTENVSYGVI